MPDWKKKKAPPSEDDDFQIIDPEDYRGDQNQEFSHQALVMKSMKRVLELGGHELADGINETSYDRKNNTTKVIYKEDTKKAFINAIKMCVAVMSRDFDDDANTNIEALFENIEEKRKEILNMQWKWWTSFNKKQQEESKLNIVQGFLHKDLGFYKMMMDYELDRYFGIFEELNKLTRRIDDYQTTDFEA